LAALLAGCAGGDIRPVGLTPESSVAPGRIAEIEHWRADGRIAVQRGNEGWSAKMRWLKGAASFQLRFIAPLGRGTYQLAGDNSRVELIVPNGQRFYAADAQSLMTEHLGWSLPLAGAHYWLRGLVAPDPPPSYARHDAAGLLQDLHQGGWRISVVRRMSVEGFELPAKLFMSYNDIKIRIVISSWTLTPQ